MGVEVGAEVGALLLAEGSEVWIGEVFVFEGEVVEALGVADEMDCWRHDWEDDCSKRRCESIEDTC